MVLCDSAVQIGHLVQQQHSLRELLDPDKKAVDPNEDCGQLAQLSCESYADTQLVRPQTKLIY